MSTGNFLATYLAVYTCALLIAFILAIGIVGLSIGQQKNEYVILSGIPFAIRSGQGN